MLDVYKQQHVRTKKEAHQHQHTQYRTTNDNNLHQQTSAYQSCKTIHDIIWWYEYVYSQ